MLTALIFLLILSLLVLIHEAGHFFVAKKFGIKVEEFGYGIPPRLWGKKIGETIYSINWLPIGGFVKLYGEDEAGSGSVKVSKSKTQGTKIKDADRAFFTRPVRQRATVVVAGVVMNVLLGVLIYYIFMGISGFKAELPLLGDHQFFGVNQSVREEVFITDVAENSPAEAIEIPPFAQITEVNDEPVTDVDEFISDVQENKGETITLTWVDPESHETVTREVTPRENAPENEGSLGVGLTAMQTALLTYETPVQKIFSGIIHPANLMVYNFDLMGQLVSASIRERSAEPLGQGVAGPVGIYAVVGQIVDIPDVRERTLQLLNMAGLLSLSLAFFNVLPIPALDGGRLFFILIEGVTGKKVNPKYEALAHTIGMAVLLMLIVLITFKDVFQFLL